MKVIVRGTGAVSGAGANSASLMRDCQPGSNHLTIQQTRPPFNCPRTVVHAIDFNPANLPEKKGLQFLTRSTQLLLSAAHEAIQDSGFNLTADGASLGLVIGTNFANLATLANYDWTVVSEGPSSVTAMDAPNTLANAPAAQLAIRLGAKSLNSTISTGRCASLDAIGYAAHFLQQNGVGAVLAGGVEEINPYVLWQFDALGDQNAIPGEAAAIILLQAAAVSPNSHPPLACFAGWTNVLAPRLSPELLVEQVCNEVLELAGLSGDEIRLIGLNVAQEADVPAVEGARKSLCRGSHRKIAAFSLKGLLGETLGASGVLHAVAAIQSFRCDRIPASPAIAPGIWPPEFEFSSEPRVFDQGPALIVDWDSSGFASALLLTPFQA